MHNFDKLNPTIQSKLNIFFDDWIKNKKYIKNNYFKITDPLIVFNNFKKDHFLSDNLFNKLSEFIIKTYNNNLEETLVSIRDYLKSEYHFKGGPIRVNPIIVGSVFLKENIKRFLAREYPNLFFNSDYLDIFLTKNPIHYSADERKCLIKLPNKHIWLTWNEIDSNLSPFSFSIDRNKEEVFNALGLGDFYFNRKEDSTLVTFQLKDSNNLIRPTIGDANFDNDLWRPTNLNFIDYGLTFPLSTLHFNTGFNFRRPESVINSKYITLNNLHNKIDNHE